MKCLSGKHILKRSILVSLGIFFNLHAGVSQGYFQQRVNYKIQVKLNDLKHELSGFESVEYINNSPDTLSFLYFHLWPNAYSDNKTELAKELFRRNGKSKLFNDPDLRGYIDSLDYLIDGRHAECNQLPGFPDICKLILNKLLLPGDTIYITTPFHIKIPEGIISRLGHIGESYQISQWYPKPAVYDRRGWHQMPYMDEAEFYSEFGDYDVSITLPSNYIVGATGNLQNEEEKIFLDALSADTAWMNDKAAGKDEFPPSSVRMKTLRYTQRDVHDFAWFADKRYHVLKGKVKLPDSGREVTIRAMFTDREAQLWKNSITYIAKSLSWFSKWNGDYPYETYTAVQSVLNSGAGMEYPGVTVIGLAKEPYLLDEVLAHEICHSWYYSALGSDERMYPFMDEGIASAYESRYMSMRYPDKKLWEISLKNRKLARFFRIEDMPVQRIAELAWLVPARNNLEQAVNLPANEYTYDNYDNIVYKKAAKGFNYLRAYLGDSVFDSIMHEYYRSWKNRHPMPEDLRAVFESGTSKDLSWFFDDFLGSVKRLDYKIVKLENNHLLIENRGELKSPVLIAGMAGDSVGTEVWEDGFEGKKWVNAPADDYTEVKIDPDHKMTELYRVNNNIRTSGLFRRADPVRLQFLYTIEDPDKRYLEFFPAFDWNSVDGFMVGVAMHNGTLLPKPAQYFIIPFYSFRNQGFTGYGNISFNITPYDYFLRLATFTLEGSLFGAPGNQNYRKLKIGADLYIRPGRPANSISQKIYGYYYSASDLRQVETLQPATMLSFLQLGYSIERNAIINPFKAAFSFESGKSFKKTSVELNYRYSYYGKNSGLDIRLFSGVMLQNDVSDPLYSFSASGRSGPEQYLYQGLYPDRFSKYLTTFWSRQMTLSEGSLTTFTSDSLGYSRWLFSLSLASSLPGKASRIPIKPYANLSLSDFSRISAREPMLLFEAGFKAGIWDFFEVYIPLVVSGNLGSMTGSFRERIRFVFRLDKLNVPRFKS